MNDICIRSASPLKRLFALAFDLVIAVIPAMIVIFDSPNSEIGFLNLAWVIFLTETIITTLVVGNGTLGDHFLRLKVVNVDGSQLTRWKLLLRNTSYGLILYLPISDTSDHIMVIISVVVIVSAFLAVFSNKNKYRENMAAVDFVFKTIVVQKTERQPSTT